MFVVKKYHGDAKPNKWHTIRVHHSTALTHIHTPTLSHTQVFVETLDRCFENVCELDLIFHVDKV